MHDQRRTVWGLGAGILALLLLLNLACAAPISCTPMPNTSHKLNDGRGLPYKAFVGVASTTAYKKNDCKAGEKCELKQSTIVASGTIVYRSQKMPNVAYILTAKHFCDHEDNIDDTLEKVGHGFFVKDFYGRSHLAKHYFSVDKPMVDACVMLIEDMDDDLGVATVGADQPEIGERIFNIAAPSGFMIRKGGLTFEGFYSGMMGPIAVYTVPVAGGSSGSALFNDRGAVIGMVWGYPLKGPGQKIMDPLSFSITVADILEIMSSIKSADILIDQLIPLVDTSTTR